MSRYVGTIRNIAAGRRMLDLHLLDDGLLVVEASLGAALGHMVGQAVRTLTGDADPTGASGDVDPAAFVAANPSSRWYPWPAVRQVRLSRNFIGVSKLEVAGADGSNEKFEWKRLQNDPTAVDALLTRAVPSSILAR